MSYDISEQQKRRSDCESFFVRCLDTIISLDYIAEISRLYLASVAEQASLSLTWSQTPEDTFSRDEAHILYQQNTGQIKL